VTPEQRKRLEEEATQTYCWTCRYAAGFMLAIADYPDGHPDVNMPSGGWTPEEIDRVIRENFDMCPRKPQVPTAESR